jgi:hypothetical protein
MGPALSGLLRNTLGSLAVLATVAVMAFGFPVLDRSMPAVRPVVAGLPYRVGGKVTVVPPDRSSVDLTRTRPSDDRGTALFVLDGVRFALVVGPYRGNLVDAAARLHDKITNTTGFQVTGTDRTVESEQGVAGLRGTYSSPGRLGQYAVFVRGDVSVEVTVSGPEQQLRVLLAAFDASLRSVAFGDAT